MILQLPRVGLANEEQLSHLATLYPEGGVKAIQALMNLMNSGVRDCLIWNRESWVGDSVGSVTGVDGDKLDLLAPIAMPPTGGCNLMYTEGVLENMISQLRDSVSDISKKSAISTEPLEALARELPRQVVILVQRLRFTKEVTRCIRENRQLSTVTRAQTEIKKTLADVLISTKDEENVEGFHANLVALQQVLHEQFQVVNLLLAAKPDDQATREAIWREQVRVSYDDKEEKIELKFFDKVITIGNEYCPPRMLITTEFTHTLRWAYLDKMHTTEPGLQIFVLKGRPGSGKNGMLLDIGALLGTLPTVIRADESSTTDGHWWTRRFTAAEKTGGGHLAPVIISQAHRAPVDALEVAMRCAEELNLHLCMTMHDGPEAEALTRGILAGCTVITVPETDMKVIAAGQLAAEGLHASDELGAQVGNLMEALRDRCSKQPHYDFGPRSLMQICSQIGYDRNKRTEEKDTVAMVIERCLLPKLVRDDVPILQELIKEKFKIDKKMVSPGKSDVGTTAGHSGEAARWYAVAEDISNITKHEPDCMVLPVPENKEDAFFEAFCKMLNRNGSALVHLEKRLSEVTGEDLFGTMPRKGEEVKDGMLVKLLRKAMEDHEHDPHQLVWVAMKTGKCSPETWEALHELLDDRHVLNLKTGEQIRLNHQLRFLFVMPDAGDTPQDTFSRSAVVHTDPDV